MAITFILAGLVLCLLTKRFISPATSLAVLLALALLVHIVQR
ncbi:MAG TPA: hypothetical protein VND64_03065 [Pirellulales bacterium]|nr:hypothetical protein [Pirellulales bacterium]